MKGRLLILGLVLVLGALVLNACAPTGAGVSVSPTLMPTAAPVDIPPTEQPTEIEESEWMTYSNERYGYSFQYPAGCFFGQMPVTCKENPPEDRPPECLCFLDAENPDQVIMQAFIGEQENLTLAQFRVSHFDSPQFNPPPGTDLIEWLGEILVGMDSDLPDEPNLSIDGIPAVKIYSPGSPQAPSFDEIYLIRDGKLLQIQMLDVDNQENSDLYDQLFSTFETIEIAEQPTEIPAPTPTSEAQVDMTRASETTSLDETWNQYTNYQLGFSIRFPKEMAAFVGSCYWNEEQGSYRPEMAFLPVQIFEDADAVYIAPEHYFDLAGKRVEENKSYYDECNQITNSLELLRDHESPMWTSVPFWKLVTQEVHDEGELEDFIKARYGSGCSLGEQVPSMQEGVVDVRILGDGKDLGVSQCPMNYGYVVKYFPSGGRVIAWNTGQGPTFLSAVDWSACYEFEMIESFQFLNVEPASTEASSEIPAPTPSEEEEVTRAAEIISLDETWNQYTNYELGFSIKFPKEMAAHRGSCTWNEEQDSYRTEMAIVPVQIYEDTDAVYIAPEHFYDPAGERVEDGQSHYDECNQITNSLELLRDHDIPTLPFWKLVAQEVRDEGELEGFIKAHYFSGCSLGEQVASAQEGVFDVKILGDGKDLAVSLAVPDELWLRRQVLPLRGQGDRLEHRSSLPLPVCSRLVGRL